MKDAMEVINTKTKGLRISKTNVKEWVLYGPIDQALKTSIQAKAVRFCPLHPPVHGVPMELELWVSGDPVYADHEERPNMMAMTMLTVQKSRDQGEELPVMETPMGTFLKTDVSAMEPIYGPAILTGAGGADLPTDEESVGCIFQSLLGQHEG